MHPPVKATEFPHAAFLNFDSSSPLFGGSADSLSFKSFWLLVAGGWMSAAITVVLIVSAEKSGGASRKPPA